MDPLVPILQFFALNWEEKEAYLNKRQMRPLRIGSSDILTDNALWFFGEQSHDYFERNFKPEDAQLRELLSEIQSVLEAMIMLREYSPGGKILWSLHLQKDPNVGSNSLWDVRRLSTTFLQIISAPVQTPHISFDELWRTDEFHR